MYDYEKNARLMNLAQAAIDADDAGALEAVFQNEDWADVLHYESEWVNCTYKRVINGPLSNIKRMFTK